ncbi:MAG: hypothetical protein GY863_17725 [bacterium]|nr:hypothetical protein [bacterium]
MYLTTHASAGLLIGMIIQEPAAAFAAGMVSHFALDMIPHEHKDDLVMEYPTKDGGSPPPRRRVIAFFFDLAIVGAITLFGWWMCGSKNGSQINSFIPIFAAISGSTIPDFVLITVYQWDNKFLRWYFEVNNRIHFIIPHSSIPRTISISYQVLLSILLVFISWKLV